MQLMFLVLRKSDFLRVYQIPNISGPLHGGHFFCHYYYPHSDMQEKKAEKQTNKRIKPNLRRSDNDGTARTEKLGRATMVAMMMGLKGSLSFGMQRAKNTKDNSNASNDRQGEKKDIK